MDPSTLANLPLNPNMPVSAATAAAALAVANKRNFSVAMPTNSAEFNDSMKRICMEHRINYNRWTKSEDERLQVAINIFGEENWRIISDYVGTRDNSKLILS